MAFCYLIFFSYLCTVETNQISLCTAKKVREILPELSRSSCYNWINFAKKKLNVRVLSMKQFVDFYGLNS